MAVPIFSGGGGGTFDGGTITGALDLVGTDPDENIHWEPTTGRWGQQTVAGNTGGAGWTDATGSRQLFIFEDATGAILFAAIGDGTEAMWMRSDALTELRPVIIQTAAPADAALSAGQCALWFDQTNGVGNTKLMVKGKSADGTVKTAAIVLT